MLIPIELMPLQSLYSHEPHARHFHFNIGARGRTPLIGMIMKKTTIACLIGLLFSTSSLAVPTSIYADSVVITASRIPQLRENVTGDISVITQLEIQTAGQSTLTEILQTQPGIEIESNGGMGSLSNIRLRGNNIQSVVVLIDGMRVSAAANGLTNFSQISLDQVDHIDILRGAASSLYGSDAIGGVIQIFTKHGSQGTHISASAGYGSFNTKKASTNISGSVNETSYSIGVASVTSDSISSIKLHSGQDADRDAYRNLSFNGNITHRIIDGHEISFQAFSNEGHINLDGNNFPAYQNNRQQIFAINSKNILSDFWRSNFKLGQSIDIADAYGDFGISNTKSTQNQIYWQNELKLPLGNLLLAYDRIEDKINATTDYSFKNRINDGYVASYQLNQNSHALNLSLREDDNSQFGNHTTGNINYAFNFADFWRISGSYGTSFRAPTFNDLYWPYQDFGAWGTFAGNPNLQPETARNKEIILAYDQGHHRLSATMFENKIKNLIAGTQGIFNDSPINVGSATILGLTVAYEGWFSNYHLRANADFQNPKNEDGGNKVLARRAKEHGAIWLGQSLGDIEIGSELIASGKRFNDAENSIPLAGYAFVNVTAKYKINSEWSANARINNLLDKDYALSSTAYSWAPSNPAYNTPGANIFVSMTYTPKF